jgi:RNA polymerase sigma factor (sigma-70 family)
MTATRSLSAALRALCDPQAADGTDAELLGRFVSHRDGDAFAALVRRHGPVVLGVCRRVLRHEQDAEDAFQATFLVLARDATAVRRAGSVGSWLYGVAHNVSRKARAMRQRRRIEERGAVQPRPGTPAAVWDDFPEVLDQELQALPEKYRTPIVLCDLGGRTVRAAAAELGCPPKTLSTRLARGRALLGRRLVRRGVSLSAGGLAAALAPDATAAVPTRLVGSTVEAAVGSMAAVPPAVVALAEGVSNVMTTKTVKCVAVVACGLLTLAGWAAGAGQPAPPAPVTPPAPPNPVARAAPVPQPAGADDPAAHQDDFQAAGFHFFLTRGAVSTRRLEGASPSGGNPILDLEDRMYLAVARDLNLSLTPAQVEELNEIEKALTARYEKEKERVPHVRDLDRVRLNLCREYMKSVNACWARVLNAEQSKRLAQIERQFLGVFGGPSAGGVGYPRIQDVLTLTADQRKQIRAINDEVQADWQAKHGAGEWGADDITGEKVVVPVNSPTRYWQLCSSARGRAHKLLMEAQRKAWKEMTGEPLDLESIVGRGRTLYFAR